MLIDPIYQIKSAKKQLECDALKLKYCKFVALNFARIVHDYY